MLHATRVTECSSSFLPRVFVWYDAERETERQRNKRERERDSSRHTSTETKRLIKTRDVRRFAGQVERGAELINCPY